MPAPARLTFASLQNFLNGGPVQNYSGASPGSVFERTYRYNTFGFYFQDDIKLASRLVLNAGLRYEFNTNPSEINGLNSNIKDIRTAVAPELGADVRTVVARQLEPSPGVCLGRARQRQDGHPRRHRPALRHRMVQQPVRGEHHRADRRLPRRAAW